MHRAVLKPQMQAKFIGGQGARRQLHYEAVQQAREQEQHGFQQVHWIFQFHLVVETQWIFDGREFAAYLPTRQFAQAQPLFAEPFGYAEGWQRGQFPKAPDAPPLQGLLQFRRGR